MPKSRKNGKIALVSHCILNQNSRALDLAQKQSVTAELLHFLAQNEIGIIQMPCPELGYAGALRTPKTREQYDTVAYRKHCTEIAEELAKQIQQYMKCGIKLEFILGVKRSPSCGKSGKLGIFMEELRKTLDRLAISAQLFEVDFDHVKRDIAKIKGLAKLEA